jgi:hypothetical protein
LDLDLYVGGGPTSYYFLNGPSTVDVESNRDRQQQGSVVANLSGALGVRWRIFGLGTRLHGFLNACYRAEMIGSRVGLSSSDDKEDHLIDFAGVDVFHGPFASFSASL